MKKATGSLVAAAILAVAFSPGVGLAKEVQLVPIGQHADDMNLYAKPIAADSGQVIKVAKETGGAGNLDLGAQIAQYCGTYHTPPCIRGPGDPGDGEGDGKVPALVSLDMSSTFTAAADGYMNWRS